MGTTDAQATPTTTAGGIELVEQDGVQVLRLRGEVDGLAVAAWQAAAPAAPRAAVAVDASAATFLDCRGLRLLLQETAEARRSGRLPELRRPSRAVHRLVEMAGAAPLFATVR
jgi:anti-anti-sigma factor